MLNENDWKMLSFQELGSWVHLLTKRALRSKSTPKIRVDLQAAQDYLDAMQKKLNDIKENI
jgi:hypothetical protein